MPVGRSGCRASGAGAWVGRRRPALRDTSGQSVTICVGEVRIFAMMESLGRQSAGTIEQAMEVIQSDGFIAGDGEEPVDITIIRRSSRHYDT